MAESTAQKQRNSSFELLRIICMLLIVAHHYVLHTKGLLGTGTSPAEETFLLIFAMYGKIGLNVFILITGYFSAAGRLSYRRVVEIAAAMTAWYWGIVLFYLLREGWGTGYLTLHNLFPIIWGNWFVVIYIWFSLFIPFLNKLLLSLDKAAFLRLIIVLFLVRLVLPGVEGLFALSNFEMFTALYCIGAYVRLHVPAQQKVHWLWYLPCVFSGLVWLANFPMFYLGLGDTGLARFLKSIAWRLVYEQESWLAVLIALSAFLVFRSWNFCSVVINKIARCVMGVYLIHENEILRAKIWESVSPGTQWLGTKWLVPHAVLKTLAVFLVCLLADTVRIWVFAKTVDPLLDRWWARSRLARVLEKEI